MTTIQALLRKTIVDSFKIEELEMLCADIGIDSDEVPGRDKGKDYYLSQIIDFAQRRGKLDTFVKHVKETRPLLQLDVFSLDAVSISGWLYGDAHLEIDQKLFQEYRDRLRESMQFVRDHDFARPFPPSSFDFLRSFIRFTEEPESEFFNPRLNGLRLSLSNIAFDLDSVIVAETYTYEHPNGREMQGVVLDPHADHRFMVALGAMDLDESGRSNLITIQENRRENSIKALNRLSSDFWEAYYDFVREGRRQLGVA